LEAGDSDGERAVARLADSALWSVTFHEPWEVPIAEHDTWLNHGLATDSEGRIPTAVQFGPKRRVRRASPKMLAFFEGLFRALAETTEDELDAGQWRRVVQTSEGELKLGLSLPDVLTPPAPAANGVPPFNPLRQAAVMDGIHDLLDQQDFKSEEEIQAFLESEVVGKVLPAPSVKGPKDEARNLAIEAMDTPGRRGIALARRALRMDPDSPVAHLALAMRAPDSETAVKRYREAVAAAERALDPEILEEGVGSFWLISETRPYMEARKGLGDALWFVGQHREAVEHYTELLRLNPNDNQGIRDRLAPALVLLGDDAAAEELLERYADDFGAAALFNRALLTFRRKGDGKEAKGILAEALDNNRHVPDLLLSRVEMPDELPDGYQLGSVEEAVFYFLEAEEAWRRTPGALNWLADAIDAN
jgi:tetratricopeptide (TPR) repeat protein